MTQMTNFADRFNFLHYFTLSVKRGQRNAFSLVQGQVMTIITPLTFGSRDIYKAVSNGLGNLSAGGGRLGVVILITFSTRF